MAEYKTTVTETEDGGRTITSGNMTEEQAANLAAKRERTKNMNTSDSASVASDALDKDIAAKKRYAEMQNILASGKHKSMSDEEKAAFVKEYKKLKLDYSFNEGGVVPMNSMAKQMEMFDDGGLMDEGGTVDPVSGNDVPPGSNQEEVRDDIPAQLSEGEFVFPADVVRYFGLEKLMEMRQEAKMGLQRMEDMGQMGNSEEAIMPDNLPFSIEDLDMEDDEEYNEVKEFAPGGLASNNSGVFFNPASQPTTGVAAAPMQAASSNIARSIPIAQAATPVQAGSSNQPAMFNNYALPQAPVPVMSQRDDLPAFLGEVTPGVGGVDYVNEVYENEAGATETFRRYTDGRLLNADGTEAVIPEGYTIKTEADKKVTTDPTKVKTATVQDDGGTDKDDVGTSSTIAFGGEIGPKGDVINSIRGSISYRGANYGTGPLGLGGIKDVKGLMARSLSSGINQITGGSFGTPMTLNKGESVVIENLIQSRPGVNNNVDLGTVGIELDSDFYNTHVSGKGVTQRGKVAEVARFVSERYGVGKTAVYDKDGKLITEGSRLAKGSILSASQVLDQIDLEKSRADRKAKVERAQQTGNYDEVIADAIQDAKDYSESAGKSSVTGVDDEAFDAGYGKGTPAASAPTSTSDYSGFDPSSDMDGDDPAEGGGGYSSGMGVICLTEDMKVRRNGVIDFVTNIKVGDLVDNTTVTEVLHKHMREGYYKVNGELKITNDHPVLANGSWKRTEDLVLGDYINNVEVTSLEYVEQITPTVYIGTTDDRYNVYTEGEVYTVHGQYKNVLKKAA